MGDFLARYFGHDGRIGRKTMWIGLIVLAIVIFVLQQILYLLFGFGMVGMEMNAQSMSETSVDFLNRAPTLGWLNLIVLAGYAYPLSALLFKRSHDINKSGFLVVVSFCLAAFYFLLMIFGWAYQSGEVMGITVPVPTLFGSIVQLAGGLLGLYLLVTLGFFPGTKGSNLYGTDPKSER